VSILCADAMVRPAAERRHAAYDVNTPGAGSCWEEDMRVPLPTTLARWVFLSV
jgi:hypothetical protein